jgi:hypothetical protein
LKSGNTYSVFSALQTWLIFEGLQILRSSGILSDFDLRGIIFFWLGLLSIQETQNNTNQNSQILIYTAIVMAKY